VAANAGAAPPARSGAQRSRGHMIGPYLLKRVLGQGSASVVRQAEHKETGEQVAVKIISKGTNPAKRRKSVKACREISILRAISHANVVKLYRTYESRTHFFLVMELVKGMELFDYLINKGRLSLSEALVIFSQVVKGLIACHERGVVHRDLKAENILLDTEGNVKIVDFELANFVRREKLRTFCGSSYYAPPEICAGQVYDGEKADVWSMGVLLYMMVVGEYPFDDENDANLIKKILHKRVEFPPSLNNQIKDLIDKLLTKDPRKRIPAARIPHHPVFFDKGRNLYFDISELPASPAIVQDRRVQVLENLVLELERQLLPEVQSSLQSLSVSEPSPTTQQPQPTPFSRNASSSTIDATPGPTANPLAALKANPDWTPVPHSGSGERSESGGSTGLPAPVEPPQDVKSRPAPMAEERSGSGSGPGPGSRPSAGDRGGAAQLMEVSGTEIQTEVAEDPLWWIMYRSQLEVKKSDDPIGMIKRIAKSSLHKNRSLQVGGMLYCDRKTGRIIQILEGRRSVLKQLAAAIMMDTRHTRFMIIKNEPVPQRMFKDWGMSFANTLSSFQRNRLEQRAAPSTTGDTGDEKSTERDEPRRVAKRSKAS